jgi:hypothetical protein
LTASTSPDLGVGGAGEFEIIFNEMEKELGEDITKVVIEAQRRFAKGGSYFVEDAHNPATFRTQLAIRGMGNLQEMDWAERRLRLLVENPCLHPLLIGTALGMFELSKQCEGEAEWTLAEDGDLSVEISASP